ncbi:hypothetical protein [Sulfurimonas indica]|uniref:hypothetical protein n=1 Tax=Sulfurimonas indica TaxID=2508707 RepID=UPI0012643472|nr:hypothetical protein [Sulfurimonas indica]
MYFDGKSDEQIKADMSDIKRVGAMGVAGEIAKGDAFQKGVYKGNLKKYQKDIKTGEEEKLTGMHEHSSNLRKNYGRDLNGKFKDKTLAQSISNEIEDIDNQKAKLGAHTAKNAKIMKALDEKKASLQTALHDAKKGLTLGDVNSLSDQSKQQSLMGQALGIQANNKSGINYAQNAMYGEMSKQQSTAAKIKTQGGVEKAVSSDVAEASLKAKMQQMGTQGSISEYLQSKAGGGYSPEVADKMAKAIMEGGKGAAEFMKQAISGAGGLAFSQAAAKTGKDITTVQTLNDKFKNGGYVGFEKHSAAVAAAGAAKKLMVSENFGQEKADAYIKRVVGKSTGADAKEKRKQAIEDLYTSGLTDKNGKSLSGLNAAIAQEEATAGTMNRDTRMMIGKNRVNFSTNANTGETIANVDGSTDNKQGDHDETNNSSSLAQFQNRDIARTILKAAHKGKEPTDKEIDSLAGSEQFMSLVSKGNYGKALAADGVYNILKGMNLLPKNMNKDEFHTALDGALLAASPVAATAIGMAGEKALNAGQGKRVFTEDYDTGKLDKEGNPIIKHAGDEFNLKDFPKEDREAVKAASRVQDTRVTKMGKGAWDGLKSGFGKTSEYLSDRLMFGDTSSNPTNNPGDSSTNSGDNQYNSNTDEKVSDKPHDNSFNSDNSSITNNQEKVNTAQNNLDSVNKDIKRVEDAKPVQLAKERLKDVIGEHIQKASKGSDEMRKLRELKANLNSGGKIDLTDFEDAGIGLDELHKNDIQTPEKVIKDKKTGKTKRFKTMDLVSSGEDIKHDRLEDLKGDKFNAEYDLSEAEKGLEKAKATSTGKVNTESGGRTSAYQDYLDSIAKNGKNINKDMKRTEKLANIAEHVKNGAEGVILGEVMNISPKQAIDEKSYRLANAYAGINNAINGIFDVGLGAVAQTANHLDKINPFGNPFNELSKDSFGVGLSQVATSLVTQGFNDLGNVPSNAAGIFSGSHNVAGYNNHLNNGVAGETIVAPPAATLGQALTQQITQSAAVNTQALATNPANTVIQTVGGQKAITTNGGRLTIGGVGTQVPAQEYMQAMQNPQMREQFSQMLAQSDLSSYGINGIGTNSMQGLMQNLGNNASILESGTSLQQLQQAYGGDTSGGGVDIEEMMKTNRINNMSD